MDMFFKRTRIQSSRAQNESMCPEPLYLDRSVCRRRNTNRPLDKMTPCPRSLSGPPGWGTATAIHACLADMSATYSDTITFNACSFSHILVLKMANKLKAYLFKSPVLGTGLNLFR